MINGTDVTRSGGAVAAHTEAPEVALAKKVVLDLSKAVTNMRFYLANNPLVVRSKTAVYEGISSFLEAFDTMSLELTDTEITYKENSVYENEKKAQSLAFLFYRDGLRRISFHKGLSLDEVNTFLQLICEAMNSPEDEMDIVSSMWNADFANIEYIAVEPFVETDEPPSDNGPPEEREPKVAGNAYSNATELENEASASSSGAETKEEKAAAQLLGTLDSEQIRKRIQPLVEFSPLSILGDILLDLFELEEKPSERKHLLNLVEEYVKELISQERFSQASEMIPEVRQALRNVVSDEEYFEQLLDSLLQKLTSAVCSEGLKREIRAAFPKDPIGVISFLEAVGPGTMPVLFELVPVAEDVESRASLRTTLFTLASKDMSQLAQAVSNKNPQVAREAVAVIARVADPRGVRMLAPCLRHSDVSVRTQAVHALGQIDHPEATKLILEFLKDADIEVRILAAKTIDISKEKFPRQTIIDMIASRSFRARPPREKIAIVDIFKRAESEDAVPVFAPFFRRGFFRRREEDSVMTAIIGLLASIGTESARKLLEQGSRWRRKPIATECLRALRQLNKE
ncbi:MAG: HEAT repeat domain-containing protein [bacterium]